MARKSRKEINKYTANDNKIYNTAIYARISIEDKRRIEAESIENQIKIVEQYCKDKPEFNICKIYKERGVSGATFDRIEFNKLIDDIKNKKINCIIVKDLSRLGRNHLETGNYIEKIFPLFDLRLISLNDNFDSLKKSSEQSNLTIPLKNLINEYYSKEVSKKMILMYKEKRKNRLFTGSHPPYGYKFSKNEKGRIEVDKEVSRNIEFIFSCFLKGMSCGKIAKTLNNMSVLSPGMYFYSKNSSSKKNNHNFFWNENNIKSILNNQYYIGNTVFQKSKSFTSGSKRRIYIPNGQLEIIYNTHEAIIDYKDFEAAQNIIEEKQKNYYKLLENRNYIVKTENIYKKILFCGNCGYYMKRKSRKRKKGQYYIFCCGRYYKYYADSCKPNHIHEKDLNENIINVLKFYIKVLEDIKFKDSDKFDKYNKSDKFIEQINFNIQKKNKEINKLKEIYNTIYENYKENLLTEEEYIFIKAYYKKKIDNAEIEIKHQKKELYGYLTDFINIYKYFNTINNIDRKIIEIFIYRINIYDSLKIEIIFRYKDDIKNFIKVK